MFDAWLRAPRAAAVSVIGMLGFGVVVGSAVGGGAASLLTPILVAVAPHAEAAPASPPGSAGGPAGSGGGGGPATITVTSPAATPAPAALAGSAVAAVASPAQSPPTAPTSNNGLPPIKHVFVVTLSDQGFNQTFVHHTDDPFLAKTLVGQGELVYNYYGVAGGPLANEIALVSGQGPTAQTVENCPKYDNIVPGEPGPNEQIIGNGCVYPKSTPTIADQLTASHKAWRAYVQTLAEGRAKACIHPRPGASDLGTPSATDPYVTWRNPFMYFHSTTGKECAKDNVGLGQLRADLKSASTTPALSYIVPDVCDDGSDTPCAPGASAGLAAADNFLRSVVPEIRRSPAYRDGALIAITFDQAPQSGPNADSTSCCDNPTYLNLPPVAPTSTTTSPTDMTTSPTDTTTTPSTVPAGPPGGGQVGLLLLSPYVKKGTSNVIDSFNHFSLQASIEDLFGLKRLGYAADKQLPVFGSSVYTAYRGG